MGFAGPLSVVYCPRHLNILRLVHHMHMDHYLRASQPDKDGLEKRYLVHGHRSINSNSNSHPLWEMFFREEGLGLGGNKAGADEDLQLPSWRRVFCCASLYDPSDTFWLGRAFHEYRQQIAREVGGGGGNGDGTVLPDPYLGAEWVDRTPVALRLLQAGCKS